MPRRGSGAPGETGGRGRARQRAPRVEASVLRVPEPIEGVGGTRSAREAISARALRPCAAACAAQRAERSFRPARRGPRAPTAPPRGARRPGPGVRDLPHPVQDERARRAITPTARGDLADRGQATQEKASRRDEAPPGARRAFPAVGAHRRGAVGGRKGTRLLGPRAGRGLQRGGRGRSGHRRAQEAAASPRGRARDLVSQGPGVLRVGQHGCGERRGLRDGAPHHGGPSPGPRHPLPVQRLASAHEDPGSAGHAPVAPRAGLCHGLGLPDPGGQQARRPAQAPPPGGGLARKAPAPDRLREGPALVMPHNARADAGGTPRRRLTTDRRQMLAEARRMGHARCGVRLTLARHTETLASGWCHGSVSPYSAVCSMHSRGRAVQSSSGVHRLCTNHEIRWNQGSCVGEWLKPGSANLWGSIPEACAG